ncbi:MAG: gamma-glutamyltransferase [Planctomycetaceae bacterium]
MYLNGGEPFTPGDRFHSPLDRYSNWDRPAGSERLPSRCSSRGDCRDGQRAGGIFTREDLSAQQPVVREPVRGEYAGYEVISMPPPSSGGIAIIETLNILTAFERLHPQMSLTHLGQNDPLAVHVVTEALKHAFADRAEFLGDTDFAEVPVDRLLSQEHAARLAAKIDPDQTQPLESYGRFAPVDDGGTSHLCVIDREGNAVASTETINTLYGSYVVEPTYGIILNNEMDDLSAVPGQPNAFGLIQSEANAVAPGKKPLSSMSPTILVQDGKATFVAGASGGPRIITATLQVLLNVTRFGQTVEQAVASPRFHHQWLPETLFVEPALLPSLNSPLEERGHTVTHRVRLAATQAASRTADSVSGASDPRKGGRPAWH